MIHVVFVKPNVMQKLDGMNIIIQLKIQNHKTPSTQHQPLLYMGCHFKCSKKMLRPGRIQKHHILLYRNLILTNKRILKDQFHLEMASITAINDIIQTHQKDVHFFFFSVCCIVFNCSFNRDLNGGCLVYMFSLCFSGSTFLTNPRRQFRVRKISYASFCGLVRKSFHFACKITISKMRNLCSRLPCH